MYKMIEKSHNTNFDILCSRDEWNEVEMVDKYVGMTLQALFESKHRSRDLMP
jgi:hypothetical protein